MSWIAGMTRGMTPQKSAILRRVFSLGENAMIGTCGRARLTVIALDPDSVNATM